MTDRRDEITGKMKAIREEFDRTFRLFLRLMVAKAPVEEVDKIKVKMMRLEAQTFQVRADLANLTADETEGRDAPAPVIDPTNIDVPDAFPEGDL